MYIAIAGGLITHWGEETMDEQRLYAGLSMILLGGGTLMVVYLAVFAQFGLATTVLRLSQVF